MKTSLKISCPLTFRIGVGVALLFNVARTHAYDLSGDFSLISNPAGPWSYGSTTTLGGPFSLFGQRQTSFAQNGVQLEYWVLNPNTEPNILINNTAFTATSDGSQGALLPGEVLLYPGIFNQYLFGVARFTVPQSGMYLVQTSAHSYLNGTLSGDSELHVLDNGSQVFGQFIAANGSASYTSTLNLTAGDTIDFAIGRGLDSDGNYSGQILHATLALVPEPSVFALAGLGSAATLLAQRRKRAFKG